MELKANELRIGNLIYAPSGVEKYVFGTRYKTILYTAHLENPTYGEAYDYECEPIPITEEWLLKFGFSEPYRKGYFVLELEDDSYLFFNINSRGYAIKPIEEDRKSLCTYLLLTYVHQLQNLYFALTNQELEIKM